MKNSFVLNTKSIVESTKKNKEEVFIDSNGNCNPTATGQITTVSFDLDLGGTVFAIVEYIYPVLAKGFNIAMCIPKSYEFYIINQIATRFYVEKSGLPLSSLYAPLASGSESPIIEAREYVLHSGEFGTIYFNEHNLVEDIFKQFEEDASYDIRLFVVMNQQDLNPDTDDESDVIMDCEAHAVSLLANHSANILFIHSGLGRCLEERLMSSDLNIALSNDALDGYNHIQVTYDSNYFCYKKESM